MADFRPVEPTRPTSVPSEQSPDLLAALGRQWLTILIAALIGALLGWGYAAAKQTTYEARSTLLLIPVGNESDPGGGRNRSLDVDTWATVARSTNLLQDVATQLGRELPDVRGRTTATAAPTGDVLVLTFEARDRDAAIDGATVYSDLFLANRRNQVNADTVKRETELNALAEDTRAQIADLTAQIEELAEETNDGAADARIAILSTSLQLAVEDLADINTELATMDTDIEAGRILVQPSTNVQRTGVSTRLATLAGLLVGALIGLIVALLRDRYDDRYGSAVGAENLGIKEIARIPYAPEGTRRERDGMHAYSRLITLLTFANRGEPDAGRSVLLLPVDSRTLPRDSARRVAATLESSGTATGMVIGVWSEHTNLEAGPAYWDATVAGVQSLTEASDLALVPVLALDRAATGLGLAALADDTLLLVSESTPMQAVLTAIEDLRTVDVNDPQVVVITGAPSSSARRGGATRQPASEHATQPQLS
jgi:hypothetical protein